MKIFKFCPNCCSANINLMGIRFHCNDCGFIYFHNVAGAVAVIIQKNDEILLTIRNKKPKKNLLDLPGGFLDPQESAEEGAVREIKEELNIDLSIDKLEYIASYPNEYEYKKVLYNTTDIFYFYKDDNLEIKNFDEVELKGFVWKKIKDISIDELSFISVKNAITLLLDKK